MGRFNAAATILVSLYEGAIPRELCWFPRIVWSLGLRVGLSAIGGPMVSACRRTWTCRRRVWLAEMDDVRLTLIIIPLECTFIHVYRSAV